MNRWARVASLVVAWTAVSGVCVGADTRVARPGTWDELLRYALDHSPRLRVSRATLDSRSADAEAARAARWGSVDLASRHGWERRLPEDQSSARSPWESATSVTLSVPMVDNGTRALATRRADDQATLARLEAEDARDQFLRDFTEAWLRLLAARARASSRQAQVDALAPQWRLVEAQARSGARPTSDLLWIEARVRSAEAAAIAARNECRAQSARLRTMAGLDTLDGEAIEVEVVAPTEITIATMPLRSAPGEISWDKTRQSEMDRLRREGLDQQLTATRLSKGAQVALDATASYGASGYLGTGVAPWANDGARYGVGITFNMPLLDAGTRAAELRSAAATREAGMAGLEQSRLEARSEWPRLRDAAGALGAMTRAAEAAVQAERKKASLVSDGFRRGRATSDQLALAMENLGNAEDAYMNALIETQRNWAAQHYWAGTIMSELVSKGASR